MDVIGGSIELFSRSGHYVTESIMRIVSHFLAGAITLFSTAAAAQMVSYEAIYVIDSICAWESGTGSCGTPVPVDQEWTQLALGDRFVVNFTLDTSKEDTNDTNTNVSNPVIDGSIREGEYSALLNSLSISPLPGNTGTFDPSTKVFKTESSVAETLDNVATWVAPPSYLFHQEKVRLLTGVEGAVALSGELTNVSLSFLNYPVAIGAANLEDLLDDRSFTTDPFPFEILMNSPDDLTLLTDDVVNTAFSSVHPHPFRRPFTLHFGEVIDYDDFGGYDLDDLGDLHVSGTFESLRVVDDTTRPVPVLSPYGLGLAVLGLFMFAAFAFRRMA